MKKKSSLVTPKGLKSWIRLSKCLISSSMLNTFLLYSMVINMYDMELYYIYTSVSFTQSPAQTIKPTHRT